MKSFSKLSAVFFILIFSLQIFLPISAQTDPFFPVTWKDPLLISNADIQSSYPNIVTDTNNITSVVWIGRISYSEVVNYKFKDDSGSWSAVQGISTTLGVYATPVKCSMILDKNNNVHVAWLDTNNNLYYRYLHATYWSSCQLVANLNDTSEFSLASFLDGSIVFVWNAINNTKNQLFSRCFYPQFNSWSDIIQITNNNGNCRYADITIDSTNIAHLIWVEEIPSIYSTGIKYTTFNKTYFFTNETEISTLAGLEYDNPCIITDCLNNVHVAWEEKVGFPSYERRLVYRYLSNGNWSSKKYFDLYGSATNPIIKCDSNNLIHLLWSESNCLIYKQIGENGLCSDYDFVIRECCETVPDMFVDHSNIIHIIYSGDDSVTEPSYYGVNYITGEETIIKPTTPPISVSIGLSFQITFLLIFGLNSVISLFFIYKRKRISKFN